MIELLEAAKEVASVLQVTGLPYCVIGGLALQCRGEQRFTTDVDFTILTGFTKEPEVIDVLLGSFQSRIPSAREHGLNHRVLLLQTSKEVPVDVGLAGFPYEEDMLRRAELVEYSPGYAFPTVTAEDLIVMKSFAGRGQDWVDVRGIIVRQTPNLDWAQIESSLVPLLELLEAPERWPLLLKMRSEVERLLAEDAQA